MTKPMKTSVGVSITLETVSAARTKANELGLSVSAFHEAALLEFLKKSPEEFAEWSRLNPQRPPKMRTTDSEVKALGALSKDWLTFGHNFGMSKVVWKALMRLESKGMVECDQPLHAYPAWHASPVFLARWRLVGPTSSAPTATTEQS